MDKEDVKLDKDDVRIVCEFIVSSWPHYEDRVNWLTKRELDDYEWGRAALRLRKQLTDRSEIMERLGINNWELVKEKFDGMSIKEIDNELWDSIAWSGANVFTLLAEAIHENM